jgi:hypothetical protein
VTSWPSTKARRVYAALLNVGWQLKRQSGSHRTLSRAGYTDFVELTVADRGRPVLAMDRVLGRTQWRWWPAAQLGR